MIYELKRDIDAENWDNCINYEDEEVKGIYKDGVKMNVETETIVGNDKLYINIDDRFPYEDIKKYIELKYGVRVKAQLIGGASILECSF